MSDKKRLLNHAIRLLTNLLFDRGSPSSANRPLTEMLGEVITPGAVATGVLPFTGKICLPRGRAPYTIDSLH